MSQSPHFLGFPTLGHLDAEESLPPRWAMAFKHFHDMPSSTPESVSPVKGLWMIMAGAVGFILLWVFLKEDIHWIGSPMPTWFMGLAIGVNLSLIYQGLRQWFLSILSSPNFKHLHQMVSPILIPGERIIATSVARRKPDFAFSFGCRRRGFFLFTTHRIIILALKESSTDIDDALLRPAEHFQVQICDIGDPAKVSFLNQFHFSPCHLTHSWIKVIPEDSTQEATWKLQSFTGYNAWSIREIRARLDS